MSTYLLDIDLRNFLPDAVNEFEAAMPIDDIQEGKHTVGIAIVYPINGQPSVKFANENNRTDLIQNLSSFYIR